MIATCIIVRDALHYLSQIDLEVGMEWNQRYRIVTSILLDILCSHDISDGQDKTFHGEDWTNGQEIPSSLAAWYHVECGRPRQNEYLGGSKIQG